MLQAKDFLNKQVQIYNQPGFIELDPICIPHLFTKKQDIEIAGLFAAVFAWGQRTTIINKCTDLMNRMDNAPHEFVMHHSSKDLKRLLNFKHRTFNDTDLLYFISFLKFWYNQNESLETAFSNHLKPKDKTIENALNGFRGTFFSLTDVPHRTMKHIASPIQNSACKRLCMYLRWMVRNDNNGVDFGIWKNIKPSQLMIPLDLHVQRTAHKLGLLTRTQSDWKAVEELTKNLRKYDKTDPVKYDFALFGLSVSKV
ncbi:MAG: TIGR02757 family protein [Bacteroidota bacterium]|jgi:uncharacterized protein (TIGR02757 family)